MHHPKVTVLLPTHNRADVLEIAIESVLAQTFQDFEVLVVGDGCTDNSAEVVEKFQDKRLRWFDLPKAPNFGYANRNTALKQAAGELTAYMTHDDIWLSDHLERLIPLFENSTVEIAYSRPLWVIPRGMIVPGLFNLNYQATLRFFLDVGNQIPSTCFIQRTHCFKKYGYWDENLKAGGDWDLWTRIIRQGGERNFTYLDTPTCLHFKANWRDNGYDDHLSFFVWKQLFASGQMPGELLIKMDEVEIEQKGVWRVIARNPVKWNNSLRNAITQVVDTLASQAIKTAHSSIWFSENMYPGLFPQYKLFGFELQSFFQNIRSKLIEGGELKEKVNSIERGCREYEQSMDHKLSIITNELNTIKGSFTWRLHEWIVRNTIIMQFYLTIVRPILKLFFMQN